MIDVTDDTFERDVMDRSEHLPVVVDLWAPWCGPCRTLGPIIERAVEATDGAVELVKINVDDNPRAAEAFRAQSIPAVYAIRHQQIVDGFIGALPEPAVVEFVGRLVMPPSEADLLVAIGDEASLRAALEIESDHGAGVLALACLLVDKGEPDEALQILARIPDTAASRQVAAEARLAVQHVAVPADGIDGLLENLLDRVKDDSVARQEFLDLLATLDPEDERIVAYRKALATRLF